ncbi:MAG: hypothetical protein JW885_11265 [Deltaproteobacteria bacterium]|nr:hypothetical protein [Candidatus Zymogenaceae bacterium]
MEYKEFKAETLAFLRELSDFPRDQREEAIARLLREFEAIRRQRRERLKAVEK